MPTLILRLSQDLWLNGFLLRSGINWASARQYQQMLEVARTQELINAASLQVIDDPVLPGSSTGGSTGTGGTGTGTGTGVNANDIGDDMFLVIGQSNAQGHSSGIDANLDFSDPGIMQFGSSGTAAGTIILAQEPLFHMGQIASAMGFPLHLAKWYKRTIPPNRRVVLICCADGGTGFTNTRWNPGNDLYNNAIARANAALALNPRNKLVAIIWHQGEQDVAMTKAQYATALDAMINGLRAAITGAANVPFVAGEMVRSWVAADATRARVQEAIQELPTRRPNCYVVSSQGLAPQADGIHFSAASMRILGERYFQRLNEIINPTAPPAPTAVAFALLDPTTLTASWTQTGVTTSWEFGYRVVGGSGWITSTVTTPFTTITGLSASTNYEYQVRAINSVGSSQTATGTFNTNLTTVPRPQFRLTYEGNFNDVSGNNVTTANTAATLVNNTQRGNVVSFPSTGATQIAVSAATPASYTKAAWVQVRSGANPTNPNIISSVSGDCVFWMSGNSLRVSAGHGTALTMVNDPNVIVPGTWYHFAVSYNATTNTYRLYRNGALVATATAGVAAYSGSATPTRIGAFQPSDNCWDGLMDDTMLWNSVLSDAQIAAITNGTFTFT